MLTVGNPEYKLVFDDGSILYSKKAVRIVVLCQHQRTGKIEYLKKEYEYPM